MSREMFGGFRDGGPQVQQKDFRPGQDCFWCKGPTTPGRLVCGKCTHYVDEAYQLLRESSRPQRSDAETVAFVRDYLAQHGRI